MQVKFEKSLFCQGAYCRPVRKNGIFGQKKAALSLTVKQKLPLSDQQRESLY